MTCPEIGNYGVAGEDVESSVPQVAGFVMRSESLVASNWRSGGPLRDYLAAHGVVGIAGVDTRALTRRLRSAGVMRGVIAAGDHDPQALVAQARRAPSMAGADLVKDVTCRAPFDWPAPGMVSGSGGYDLEPRRVGRRRLKVAAWDFGMKWNILRRLSSYGCDVRVYPASAPASTLLADRPSGVFLSNGPGDPAALPYVIENVRAVVAHGTPVFGICLGHQVLGLALGARTFKLKFGHRGSNHPVKQLETGRIEITSQNHGFAVDPDTLPADVMVTHVNLYDHTLEGFRHRHRPVFSVQYHPEASPGPHDADYLFGLFIDAMERP
jgi:carbamoyl-phosphate synthase small subunit